MATARTAIWAVRDRLSLGLRDLCHSDRERSPLLLQRKIALFHGHLPVAVGISLVVTSALAFLLPAQPGRAALLTWWLANVVVCGWRSADHLAFRRQPQDLDQVFRRQRNLVAGAAAQGCLWGVLGWFLFPAAPIDQLFLTMVMAGMAGGGIIFLSPFHRAYMGFVVPLLLPACFHLMGGASAMQKTAGYLGIVYFLSMLFASATTCRWVADGLGSTFENEGLVGRLQAANTGLEAHTARLEQEVAERTVSLSQAIAQLRQEIQEKERERERAAQSDASHLSLLQAINEGFGHVDEHETYLYANPAAEKILGVPPGTLVGRSLKAFLDPAGVTTVGQETELRRTGERNRYTLPIIRADGQRRMLEVNAALIHDDAGVFLGASAVFEDITERMRAEDDLRTALTFNDQIISSAHEGIVVYDLEGRYILWNRFMEDMTGIPSEEVLGKAPADTLPFASGVGIVKAVKQGLRGESVIIPVFSWSLGATGRSGWAASILAPMKGSQGEIIGVVETVSDMTEWKRVEALQRKLETELHHAQKLESIGSLAGGIAHDMNNVLGAIQAMVQTLKLRHPAAPGLLTDLEIIERASTRGRDLVKGLTNFVRKELEEPERLDLNDLVREEVELLGRTTFQKVALVMDLDPSLPAVMGERGVLGGALMNLCVNAMDAMGSKGTLTLRTRTLPDGRVELAVEDSGKGMAPEVAARAMEPFFTTKAFGQGTGLGLSMVYATVKAHGGSLSIQSEEGRGTIVQMWLPAAARHADPAGKVARNAQPPLAMRILQVDDDELILASIPLMLAHQGHSVTTAAGGQEALDLLAGGLEVDLVILDLNMPGMNGLETLAQLRKRHPDLPVLLATGYLDTATEAVLKQSGKALGINKPFSMQDLEVMFRRIAAMGR